MKLKPYHIIICILVLFSNVRIEAQSGDLTYVLLNLYDRILFTNSDAEKLRLNDSIVTIIDGYAASDSVFEHKFSTVRYLGQVKSSDSKIKIVNWNLMLENGSNNYFCYIIRKGKMGEDNRVYMLTGKHEPHQPATNREYNSGDWYGALYYAIEPCKKSYIILGFDFGADMISRKIIDVLSFSADGELALGKDIFERQGERRFRDVLEYSSQSVVSLRFNTPKLLIFDHLASFSGGEDNETSMGGGLSYDGYTLRKGIWTFITNVDARNPKK